MMLHEFFSSVPFSRTESSVICTYLKVYQIFYSNYLIMDRYYIIFYTVFLSLNSHKSKGKWIYKAEITVYILEFITLTLLTAGNENNDGRKN